MNRFKLVIGVILVFAVGLLAGAICTGIYYKERIKVFAAGGPPMDAKVRMLLDEFSRDLELTDTQRSEIEKILQDAQEQISELRRKTFPQIEEINDKSLELIREKLNDKQREKFNTFYNKIKRFHNRFAVRLDFPGRPFSRDLNEMKERLNLQPEQIKKIEEIMKDGFQKREKFMEESRQEKPRDFSQIRQELTKLDDQEYESIEKILSKEQREAYKKYLEEKRNRIPPAPGPGGGPRPSNGPGDHSDPNSGNRPSGPLPPPNW
ncbi:MAG: hypothetical protein PVG39_04205 [Desulfobacteraceae bacterium]